MQLICPACRTVLAIPDTFTGKVTCPKCGQHVDTPPSLPIPVAAVADTLPGEGQAVASLVLGIISLVAWIIPLVGFPVSVTGLTLGSVSLNRLPHNGKAMTGTVLNGITLVLTIINSIAGAIMYAK